MNVLKNGYSGVSSAKYKKRFTSDGIKCNRCKKSRSEKEYGKNKTYCRPCFKDINKKKFDEMSKALNEIDLTRVIEDVDNTDLSGELACAGGSCEITSL